MPATVSLYEVAMSFTGPMGYIFILEGTHIDGGSVTSV